jgi:hypothetical protein
MCVGAWEGLGVVEGKGELTVEPIVRHPCRVWCCALKSSRGLAAEAATPSGTTTSSMTGMQALERPNTRICNGMLVVFSLQMVDLDRLEGSQSAGGLVVRVVSGFGPTHTSL